MKFLYKKSFFVTFVLLALAIMPGAVASDFEHTIYHARYVGFAEIVEYHENSVDLMLLEGPRKGMIKVERLWAKEYAADNAIDQSLTKKLTSYGKPGGDSSLMLWHWPVKGSRPIVILGFRNDLMHFGREVAGQKVEFWTPGFRTFRRASGIRWPPKDCPDTTEEDAFDKSWPISKRCLVSVSRLVAIKKKLGIIKDENKVERPKRPLTEEEKKAARPFFGDAVDTMETEGPDYSVIDKEKLEKIQSLFKEHLDKHNKDKQE